MDELLSILSLRPEYFGEEKEAGPFVYNNGDYVGTFRIARINRKMKLKNKKAEI